MEASDRCTLCQREGCVRLVPRDLFRFYVAFVKTAVGFGEDVVRRSLLYCKTGEHLSFSCAGAHVSENALQFLCVERLCRSVRAEQGLQLTAYSVRSVRRESGMEECGNTLGVQAPNEPLELSIIDHSMV